MWTLENRAKYNRDHLRYPSDLTDDEWARVEPLIPPAKPGGGKRRTEMRAVMNGVMYILSTGCQWRYLPKDFPPRSTVHNYFVWWQCDRVLDRIHHALYVMPRTGGTRGQPHRRSRRYAGSVAARHRPCRRRPGSRWRHLAARHAVRSISIPPEAIRRQRLSRTDFCECARQNPTWSRN